MGSEPQEDSPVLPDTRFWKVAPGEGAHLWNLCQRDKIIAIGWPKMRDIRTISREEFIARKEQICREDPGYTPDGVEQLWKFVREIKPGDRIVANRGFSVVMGLGIVTGPCEYKDGDSVHYRHRWPVNWYDTKPRQVEQGGWMRTLVSLNAMQFRNIESAPEFREEKFYKFAPYSTCWSWGECLAKNGAMLGYDELGDLAEVHPKIELIEILNNRDSRFNKADCMAAWELTRISRGSKIVAVERDGGRVLGYGIATGEYLYDENASRFCHRVPVQWQAATQPARDASSRRKTLEEISSAQWGALGGTGENITPEPNSVQQQIKIMTNDYPLNQILYGPPGTGKTYNSIERAVEIIDSKKYAIHAEAKARFDELHHEGRIGFVTFHQSFGYEDFVEGIRPVMSSKSEGAVQYEIHEGVLKRIALTALGDSVAPKTVTNSGQSTFEVLWGKFKDKINQDPNIKIGLHSGHSEYTATENSGGGIEGKNLTTGVNSLYSCSRQKAEQVFSRFRNKPVVESSDVKGFLGNCQHYYIAAVVNELKHLDEDKNNRDANDNSGPPIDRLGRAQSYLQNNDEYKFALNTPRYVLIIDEINRGNISKILGELITLLEPDKRIGAENALTVTLPYSGENFALPPNLYVLGTMNTADKSLALLDVALRRRFKFYEYSPDFTPQTCPQLPQAARRVLLQLNHRIVLGKDRDHRIGHSFFVRVKSDEEFNEVFRNEIIPLLQEYFYNDWDGLRFVLGEEGEDGTLIRLLKTEKTRGVRNRWHWYFDAGEELDCLSVLTNNYFPASSTTSQQTVDAGENV